MANKLANNLLVGTVLSATCDFADAGAKQSLTNRIKKLSQAERKELIEELHFLAGLSKFKDRLGSLEGQKCREEKGLALLLLCDDGATVDRPGLFTKIGRCFLNTIRWRVSSNAVVNQLIAARNTLSELSKNGLAIPAAPVLVPAASHLDADEEIKVIDPEKERAEQQEAQQKAAIVILGESAKEAEEKSKRISNFNKLRQATKEKLEKLHTQLVEFSKKPDLVGPDLDLVGYHRVITDIGLLKDEVNAQSFTLKMKDADKELLDGNMQLALDALEAASTGSRDVMLSILASRCHSDLSESKLAIALIKGACYQLNRAISALNLRMELKEGKKLRMQSNFEAIQQRLKKFDESSRLCSDRRKRDAETKIADKAQSSLTGEIDVAQKNLKIIEKINASLNELRARSTQPFNVFQKAVTLMHSMIGKSRDAKDMNDFLETLNCVVEVLTTSKTDFSALAPKIDPDKYLIAKDSEHYRVLQSFRFANGFIEDSAEARQKFAKAYIEYLIVVFKNAEMQTKKGLSELEKQKGKAEADALALKQPKPPVQPAKLALIAPATLSRIPHLAPVVAMNGISQFGRQSLICIAKGIERNLNNHNASSAFYSRVKNMTNEGLNQAIYQHFYAIMKDQGAIKNGHLNWGGLVFAAEKGTGWEHLVSNCDTTFLNVWRVEAMRRVIEGEVVKL